MRKSLQNESYYLSPSYSTLKTNQQQSPLEKSLKKEEIEYALNKGLKSDEALLSVFSTCGCDTNELENAIEKMEIDKKEKLDLFLQVLVAFARARQERYQIYILQILFSQTIQKQINNSLINIRQLSPRKIIHKSDQEILKTLIIILESSLPFLYSSDQIEEMINHLMNTITVSECLLDINIRNKINTLKKMKALYKEYFNQRPYRFKERKYYYIYKFCPINPCELDYNLYRSRNGTNKLLSNSLSTIDNVNYRDIQMKMPHLVETIISEYLRTENVSFKHKLCEQSEKMIVHMWLDCYKPRRQQLEKIIEIEQSNNNKIIQKDDYKQNFKDVVIGIVNQEQFQFQEQQELADDDVNENEVLDSDEDEDRKIYVDADQDYDSIQKLIDDKISLKRQVNRLTFNAEEYNEALNYIMQKDIDIWNTPQNYRNAIQQLIMKQKLESMLQKNSLTLKVTDKYSYLLNELEYLNMNADLKIIQSKQIVGLLIQNVNMNHKQYAVTKNILIKQSVKYSKEEILFIIQLKYEPQNCKCMIPSILIFESNLIFRLPLKIIFKLIPFEQQSVQHYYNVDINVKGYVDYVLINFINLAKAYVINY